MQFPGFGSDRWQRSVGIGLIATILAAGAVAAPSGPASEAAAPATQQWEDVLLLETFRYLRVSPAQLEQLRPLAHTAVARLAQVRSQGEPQWARLEQVARQNRETLLRGQRPSSKSQAEGLLLQRALEQRRVQAEEELVRTLIPPMERLLTRGQLQQVYGLFVGEPRWDPRSLPSPALLDRSSGFVGDPGVEYRQQRIETATALQRELEALAAAAADAAANGQEEQAQANEQRARALTEEAAAIVGAELQQSQERQAPSPETLAAALRHFVRRLFLSPRVQPVVEEWLRNRLGPDQEARPNG